MSDRLESSVVTDIYTTPKDDKYLRSSSTAYLQQLELGQETEEPEFRTRVVLSWIASHNYHRLLLAIFMLSVGLATVGVVYGEKPEANLPLYYGAIHIATIPLTAIGVFVFWLRMRRVIRLLDSAAAEHVIRLQTDPTAQFTGLEWKRWRFIVTIVSCWLDVAGTIPLIVLQSIALAKACRRLAEPASDGYHDVSTDRAMIALLTLVVAGAIVTLVSMVHGAYIVTLLCGYMRCAKVRCGRSFYPSAIYRNAKEVKPVYLN